jgi:hypothetical protein
MFFLVARDMYSISVNVTVGMKLRLSQETLLQGILKAVVVMPLSLGVIIISGEVKYINAGIT